MAQPLQLNDVIAMRVWCTSAEQAAVNTFNFAVLAISAPAATDQDAADAFSTVIAPDYKAIMSTVDNFNGVQCQIIDRGFPTVLFVPANDTTDAGPGILAGPNLPRQACGLISWRTTKAGRKYRGRTYLPFPNGNLDTGIGAPTGGAVTAFTALANNVLNFTAIPGFSITLGLVLRHRGFPRAVPPIPPTDDPIADYSVPAKWATQRRRGSYGRANVSPI